MSCWQLYPAIVCFCNCQSLALPSESSSPCASLNDWFLLLQGPVPSAKSCVHVRRQLPSMIG